MKKRMLFLVTFLFVVFSVGSLFADRDIDGSFVAFEPVWLAANPNYVPGTTVAIPFILDNESLTGDLITAATLTFPTGVTVIAGTTAGNPIPDAYDFVGVNYDGSSNYEFLDYTGEFGDGASITYATAGLFNPISYIGPTPIYEAETTIVNAYGPGVAVTIDSGFSGPLVINWTLVSAGIGGPPNTISGTLIWGPPYGIDTFTITSTPNGTGGEWIVGDTLCLEVTTIDVANTVTVDLTPFGGPANFALIQDVADDSLWANCYVIGTGSSDGTSYSITATASFTPGDDTETITGLAIDNILPNVSSWGYFYHVDRQDPPDDNGVADYNYGDIPIDNLDKDQVFYVPGDESTGDGIRWFVAASDQLAGDLDSDVQLNRRIELGTINWDYWDPTIAVNDNAGNTVYGNAVNPDSLVFMDNVIPTNPDTTYFVVNPGARAIFYAGIGDVIRAVVDMTSMLPIASGEFDFTMLNPTSPVDDANYIIPGIIDGNLMYADYTVLAGDNDILTPPGLIVYATLIDSAGNFSDPPIEVGGTTGDSLYVDGTAPIILGDIDHTGYLRFSPETDPVVAPYTDMPDTLLMQVQLPGWDTIGGPDQFIVRIEEENTRALVGYKTYSVALGNVWEVAPGDLRFIWDGTVPDDPAPGLTTGDFMGEGIYGFTLWSVTDGALNEGVNGHDPESADLPLGITLFNAVHGVLDNTGPEFLEELDVYSVDDDTPVIDIYRYINDTNYDGLVDAGDVLLAVDEVYFKFGVTREFTEDTDVLRHETVSYWIYLEGPDTTKWFWGDEDLAGVGATGPQGTDTYTEYTTVDQVVFGTYLDVNSYVGAAGDIQWIADDTGGTTPEGMFTAGTYTVTALIRDIAGNITVGASRAVVNLINVLYTAPTINRIEIVSQHDGGPLGLDPFDGDGDHNFYTDGTYGMTGLKPDDLYYDSPDTIVIEIELDDITYLDSLVVENFLPFTNLGDLVFYPGDFVGNILTFEYDVSPSFLETEELDDYGVGDVIMPAPYVLAFNVEVYDTYMGSALPPMGLYDIFNLIRPEEPVWPTVTDVEVVLSDDRFSPGWYTNTYDAIANPARDGVQDDVDVDITFDFGGETTTVDFDWFLAIDQEAVDSPTRIAFSSAAFSRTGTVAAGVTGFTVPTITFYGLPNDITEPPIVDALSTDDLIVSVFAVADGYDDEGYVDPPGMAETMVNDTLWVDNTNPGIIPIDNPALYGWQGDDNYWGHLYETYEYFVAYDENSFAIDFRVTEPMPETGWAVTVVDIDGDPIYSVQAGNPQIDAVIADIVGSDEQTIDGITGFMEFHLEVDITNLDADDQYLDAVLVVVAPNDEAGNPSQINDPHYPYDIVPPYHAGSDAYRWDSAEAFVRFMILHDIPHVEWMYFTYGGSEGMYDRNGIGIQGYVGNNGSPNEFSLLTDVSGLVYTPIDVRDISTIYDIDFSIFDFSGQPYDLATIEASPDYFALASTPGYYYIDWYDTEFTDLTHLVSGDTVYIQITLSLEFTDGDAGHVYEEVTRLPLIVDIESPYIELQQPELVITRDPDMLEGNTYRIDAIVNDYLAGLDFSTATLTCLQDPSIASSSPIETPFELRNDDNVPTDYWLFSATAGNPLVIGTKFLYQAQITDVAWIDPGYFSSPTIDLYIIGLDQYGEPDMAGILYSNTGSIPNIPNTWQTFQLPTPVNALNGFLVAISEGINDGVAFYQDNGVDAPYEWMEGTTYVGIPALNMFFDLTSYALTGNNFIRTNCSGAYPWDEPIRFTGNRTTPDYELASIGEPRINKFGTPRYAEDRAAVISWEIDIPENYDIRILDFEAYIEDIVYNNATDTETWDVGNVPQLAILDFDNTNLAAPDHLKNEDDAELTIQLIDPERVDYVNISLNTNFVYPATRTYYAAGDTLTLSIAAFMALVDMERVDQTPVQATILLGSLNTGGPLVDCDEVIAYVHIEHTYDHSQSDSYDNTAGTDWLVIDNMMPVITGITYELESDTRDWSTGTVTFTANVVDHPTACIPAGVDASTVLLDLTGINGYDGTYNSAYYSYSAGVATWVLSWPDDFDAFDPMATIDGMVHVYASDLLGNGPAEESLWIDTQPVIDDVQFFVNGEPTSVILPDDLGIVHVEITLTATDLTDPDDLGHMDFVWIDRVFLEYVGTNGTFDSGAPVEFFPVRDPLTGQWYFRFDPTYSDFEIPEDGYIVEDFNVYAISMYNYQSVDYPISVVVVDYPRENFFGDTSILDPRNYIGRDPDGWFAPEHNVHGEITIWTPETLTLEDVQMNYDYLNDIANPWLYPGTMTVTPVVVDLGGTPYSFNEYLFEWEVITDAQSIWSLILPGSMGYFDTGNVQDGYYLPIPAEANFMWATWDLPIWPLELDDNNDGTPDTYDFPPYEYYIQVDLNDPAYCTENGNYFYYGENLVTRAMPNHFDLTLFRDDGGTLVPFYNTGSGTWWDPMDMKYTVEIPLSMLPDFSGDMVLRTYATDWTDSAPYPSERGGSGVSEIYEPASTDFTIIPYAGEPDGIIPGPGGSIFYANWQLTPITGFNHGDVATLDLGEVWDLCGHNAGAAPTVTFEFVADYDSAITDELLIYDWKGLDPITLLPNEETAPYVKAGDPFGISLPLQDYNARSTAVTSVQANTRMIESYCADTDAADVLGPIWRGLFTYNNLFWFLNNPGSYLVNPDYVDGDQLYTQIKIIYANGSEWTSDWVGVGARTENFAIVDGVVPYILQYGIELWSETLGYQEEGYVSPDDRDGNIRITFDDMPWEYDSGVVPDVWVTGLDQFIFGWDLDGEIYEGFYPAPEDSVLYKPVSGYNNLSDLGADVYHDGTHWVCELGGMVIKKGPAGGEFTQYVIGVYVEDPVGNQSHNPADPATKFVEKTSAGPIIPKIVGMQVFIGDENDPEIPFQQFAPGIPLNGWSDESGMEFWLGEGEVLEEDVTINVFVRAAYQVYIEEMWLDLEVFDGLTTHETVTDIQWYGAPYPNLWVGTFTLDSTMLAGAREDVTITAWTIRHPFGAFDVFTDDFTVTLHVDTEDAQVDDAVVYNAHPGFEDVMWTIDPDYGMTVVAVFGDIRGALGVEEDMDWPLSAADMFDWFYLQNDGVDQVFDTNNPYYPLLADIIYPFEADSERVQVTWHIDKLDLDEVWYETVWETEYFNFDFHFRNIYGEWLVDNTSSFDPEGVLVDNQAPVYTSAYTYGINHLPNRTIVPYYPIEEGGGAWDTEAILHLVYEDISGVKFIESDWGYFGGTTIVSNPMRAQVDFSFPYGTDIYNQSPDVSMNGDVLIAMTDNVGNESEPPIGVNTTFVFEENETYGAYVYPNEFFVEVGGNWYTDYAAMQLYVEHLIMGYDEIDNDADVSVDEMQEGLVWGPLELQVNHHIYDQWYPFPHTLEVINDTTVVLLQGDYGNLSDGAYQIEVGTENIFGHWLYNSIDFNVDMRAPLVQTIRFVGDGTLTFDMNDVIITYTDWDAIQIRFQDPIITASAPLPWGPVPGVGVDKDTTFTVTTAALYQGEDTSGPLVDAIVPLEWSGDWLVLGVDDSRWAHEALESGYYTLEMTVTDLLGNTATYTKTFFYNFQEAEIELHVFDYNYEELNAGEMLYISDEIAYLGATVNDEFGMVTQVEFELWFDVNNNNVMDAEDICYSELPAEIMDHITGVPDYDVPFEATWHILDWEWLYDNGGAAAVNEHVDAYNYRHDNNIFNTAVRDWFIVTTAYSNSGQVTRDTTAVMVIDDVGPAPTLEGITNVHHMNNGIHYMLYDYNYGNYFTNTSVIRAICQYDSDGDGFIDHNWPDAWKVDFMIEGPNGYELTIYDSYMQPPLPNQPGYYTGFWDWSQLAIDNPGLYTINVVGYDRVGNVAEGLNTFQVYLYTAGNAWGELTMWNFDVPGWDLINQIADESEFGPFNPVENIINLRVDAVVHVMNEVVEVGLFYNIWDNSDGQPVLVESGLPLPNDVLINPDFGTDASSILPQEMQDIGMNSAQFRIVVPEDVYRGPDYEMHDYTYEIYMMITDYTGVPFMHASHVGTMTQELRVDYVAPEAVMAEHLEVLQGNHVDDITVIVPAAGNAADEWADGYDLTGLDHGLLFKWSYDGMRTWNYFTTSFPPEEVYEIGNTRQYWYNDWNTYVLDELGVYNYEGWVYVTAEVQDRRGNWADAVPTQVYVDNQAPDVPIMDVSYRAPQDYDGDNPSLYQQWHEVGTLLNEEDNTINVAYNSLNTPEDAYLRMRVHQTDIQNLSYYDIPVGQDSDLQMPIYLFHGVGDAEGPEDLIHAFWLTDHEIDPEGYFHFDLLLEEGMFDPGYHYFAFIAYDTRGNLESDLNFDNWIDDGEFFEGWDLRVNLINDDPVCTEIIAPHGLFGSDWKNLGAEIVENIAGREVDEFTFQWSGDGHTWNDIATVPYVHDDMGVYTFHLYRHELPMFDNVPYVPGVHIWDGQFGSGYEITDMNNIIVDDPYGNFDPNDGPQGAWIKTIELPVDTYDIYYYADWNDNGVIDQGDFDIFDPEFLHPNVWHHHHHVHIVDIMVPFDTRIVPDGEYFFRAVPDDDDRCAIPRMYQIDNTPPTAVIDIVGNDEALPVFAVGDEVPLVTDIDDLLVYWADFAEVVYQYSVQAPGTEFRRWFDVFGTEDLPGDFGYNFPVPDPQDDNIDNDGDGYVDEPDEGNALTYLRSYAYDPAGNFGYSQEIVILADGSEPYMHITSINGQLPAGPTWVVDIPEDGFVELVATDITPPYFDDAVVADFWYITFDRFDADTVLIAENVPVEEGQAITIWNLNEEENGSRELLEEGYYALYVIARDRVENETNTNDPLFIITPIILNDVIGPEAYITSVGGRPMIIGGMFFANELNYGGDVEILLTNPQDVATVTLEYSLDQEVWHNINTVDYDGGDRIDYVYIDWELPYTEDMTYYLRALVEDYQANDTPDIVTFYYDNTDPVLAVDPMITTVLDIEIWDGTIVPVLDVYGDSIRTMLTYIEDEFNGLFDVANVTVELWPIADRTDYVLGQNEYDVPGVEGDNFAYDMSLNAVSDEYELVITLTDFAGNEAEYRFYYLVIDVTEPTVDADALEHVVSGYQQEWYAPSDGNVIQFVLPLGEEAGRNGVGFNWYDDGVIPDNHFFLGIETAVLRLYDVLNPDVEDFVDGVFDDDGNIWFDWIPDALAGVLYSAIEMEITLTDYYGNSSSDVSDAQLELYDTIASVARILEVDDNMVDWQNEEYPDVWATGDHADIDAYVPVSQDRAMHVRFEWFNGEDWEELGLVDWDEENSEITPPYEYPISDRFVWPWDISELENGDYLIRAIAIDIAGVEDNSPFEVMVHILNFQDYPVPYVWDGSEAAEQLVRGNMYSLTATSDHPEMITGIAWWYRYVDEEGVFVDDTWYLIGADDDGEVPYYLHEWLIHNTMVPGLWIQIVAYPAYTGGLEQILAQDLVDMGLYVQLEIVDVTPPEILDITFHEAEEQGGDRALLPMWINNSVTTMIDTVRAMIAAEYPLEDMSDLHRIVLTYTDAERVEHTLEVKWFDDEAGDNPYEYNYTNYGTGWDISEFANGEYDINLYAWDTADNLAQYSENFYIDTVAPTSALTITDLDGNPVDYLERGETYLLTANASDNMMIDGYAYIYTVDSGTAIVIPGDAESVEFTVPDDINYGSELEFTVTVTDMVGLTHASSVSKLVFDSETVAIIITHVAGVPYVPNLHINGEAVNLVASVLGNEAPDYITDVAFMYQYADTRDWTVIDDVVGVDLQDNTATVDWDVSELPEGWVNVGVVPVADPDNIFELPIYWATMYIDHTAPEMSDPVTLIPPYINGWHVRVEFEELPMDLNHNLVRFEFAVADQAGIEEAWTTIGAEPEFGFDSGLWFFELRCEADSGRCWWLNECGFINSEVYDFRLHIADAAIPDPNTAKLNEIEEIDAGTLFDDAPPDVFMSEIGDQIFPFDEPVEIVLASVVEFAAIAFDHPEQYPLVSDVDYVEFYVDHDFLLAIDFNDGDDVYNGSWDLTGLEIGEYNLSAKAYDRAGNRTWSESVDVVIVSNIDPIAIIAGFDFDDENPNEDRIFAITKDCVDNPTIAVYFEYTYDGVNWIPFAIADTVEIVNGTELWVAEFNANDMDVMMLRAVAVKTNGEFTTRFAVLPVTYSSEMGGMFLFPTNENVNAYYEDVVNIVNAVSKPIVVEINESLSSAQTDVVTLLDPVQMSDGSDHYQAPFALCGVDNTYGNIITFWTTTVTEGQIILEKAEMRVYPVTNALGSNGPMTSESGNLTVTIPCIDGTGYAYFERVHWYDVPAIPEFWYPVSTPEALMGNIDTNCQGGEPSIFNMPITSPFSNYPYNPEEGVLAAIHWPGTEGDWDVYPVTVSNGVAHFAQLAKTGIYMIVQYFDLNPEVEYVSVTNEWWNGLDLWTSYIWDYEWWYYGETGERTDPDSMLFAEGIDFSFRTFILEEGGQYEVEPETMIDAYLNGVKIVDYGVIDPEWVGGPVVVNPVSGVFHINLINAEYLEYHNGGMGHVLDVYVNIMGYTDHISVPFNVDSTAPQVANDGGGYIRHEMTISAEIWDPETDIDLNYLALRLYNPEDIYDDNEFIDIPASSMNIEQIDNRYHVSYTLTLDDLATVLLDSNDINEVYAEWYAINNVWIETPWYPGFNVVVYVVDIAPPIVWAVSPVGDPLDNDGDGLFNEDPINGINDDLDWDDWNNNGVQDGMWVSDSSGTYWVGEPSLIDEDPIDFWPDTLLYGTDVVVAIAYEDIPMPIVIGDGYCGDCVVYSGACGVDIDGIVVTLNGLPLTEETGTVTITNGTWQYAPNELLNPGHYVVIGSVPDMIGNVGYVSFEFEIIGPAPVVEFLPLEGEFASGWWLNTHMDNELRFIVHETAGSPVAADGVIANVYQEPSGELIMGPITIHPDGGGIYTVNLTGGVVGSNEYAVRMEVSAANVWGVSSVSNQTYLIDNADPNVEIVTPEDGTHYNLGQAVHIVAIWDDVQPDEPGRLNSTGSKDLKLNLNRGLTRNNGSGVDYAEIMIVYPDGTDTIKVVSGGDNYVETIVLPELSGIYVVTAWAKDRVGNIGLATIQFIVDSPAPTVTFYPFEHGWWFNPMLNSTFVFDVFVGIGSQLADDGVVVSFYGMPGHDLLQGPQTLQGEDGHYEVDLGANVPSIYSNIILEVTTTTLDGAQSVNSQTYGIDTNAPIVTFLSPENGQEFGLDASINVWVAFTDIYLTRTSEFNITDAMDSEDNTRDYGSGILWGRLRIEDPLGGVTIIGPVDGASEIEHTITELMAGTYRATATAMDIAGNTTAETIQFYVNESAVAVTFDNFGHAGLWYGPELDMPFSFHVTGNVANNNVIVNFYGNPGHALIQGPQNVYGNGGDYEVWLLADLTGYTAVTIEVIAENTTGQQTIANKTYGVDLAAPIISIGSPADGAVIDIGNPVAVNASYTDTGSGVYDVMFKVDGQVIVDSSITLSTLHYIQEFELGEHTLELIVTDAVMNVNSVVWTFQVTDTNIVLTMGEAHVYPNPVADGNCATFVIETSKTADVIVTIYDFAGKEVNSFKTDTRSGVIEWNLCTEKGMKVGRGVYFAKIAAYDGKSVVEKIVKIAVK